MPTKGPTIEATRALNLGVAAHITAASLGGARYANEMTSAERSSIENAIWLCQNCAKLIDNDEQRFPVEVVRAWKTVAEHRALHAIGKPSPAVPLVKDKWIGEGYIEKAGIPDRLRSEGYRIQWIFAEDEANRLEFEGWEMVVYVDKEGQQWYLKWEQRDHPYMVLMKKKTGA